MTNLPVPASRHAGRNLPQDIYGRLDVRPTSTGGIEFAVPLSPAESAANWLYYSPFRVIAGVPLAFFVLLGNRVEAVLEIRLLIAVLTYLILQVLMLGLLRLYAILSDNRFVQFVEVRPDGLTINRCLFFDRRHIHKWEWWRKDIAPDGNDDGDTAYSFEILYGARRIVVFHDIDPDAAPLLATWFESTTRRVWAREN